jgi:16S rRNA (guanine(1405)-N(7))-methyltransferase
MRHASTRERLPHLEPFFAGIWDVTGGPPQRLADLGCGLGPLALPWMGLSPTARVVAVDVDAAQLGMVEAFLALVDQPHATVLADLAVVPPPSEPFDAALLLKLVPLLDRRDAAAASGLLRTLDARHAVVSFPARSLGGRGKGMEGTYRRRLEALVRDLEERVTAVAEASVANELVFVLTLGAAPPHG